MAFRDDRHRGRSRAPASLASALRRFYALRFAVTAMTMLSPVLLPWIVWSATKRIDLAGLVMLAEAAVRIAMSLYGGQLAHAIGGRVSFAGAQALCAVGFALFAAVLALPADSLPLTLALLAAAVVVMQAGITLGNVVTEACTVALLQSGAPDVPARVRVVDLVSTGCALPLGGWLVLAFDAPMAVIALGFALAAGAALATARAGAVYDHANARAPARFSLVDGDAWRWLAANRRARSLTLFLLVASVPVTMLFGALPFLLANRTAAGLPAWVSATDVLFLTHYKAFESIAAALVLVAWVRWAGAARRRPLAVHAAFGGYVASMAALIVADSALASAFAAVALAASYSPLMVWVRTERAALVPEHNRQRISGLLVAIDAMAYVLGALAVRYAGFEPAALAAIAAVAAMLFVLLHAAPRAAPTARRADIALPALDEKLVRYRAWLEAHRAVIEERLAEALPRLGLVKRAAAPPDWATPLALAPADAVVPIGVGLMPVVLPRALRDAGVRTASIAASSEEVAAMRRPLDDVRADALAQGWHPRVLAHLLPDTAREFESRMHGSFHRLRVDTLLRPGAAPGGTADASSALLATRFAPIEVNNGGSQGHWICSAVNHALVAALGLDGRKVFDRPDALVDDVYEAFVDWLAERMTPRRFAHAFPQGHVPLAFVSGPYAGRMVNDIEGPRIAARIAKRYGVGAGYFVGFDDLELGRTLRVRDREMALVKRRGAGDGDSYAVWSDLYVTDSMDHVAAAVDSDDARTRALSRAFLEGRVLGVSAWPGRELCENDKLHAVDKANAHALRESLGLSAADAALLQQAAPAAFAIGGGDATVAKLCDERERWVVKARYGCGGSAVIVGAKPSWPAQRLPRIDRRDGGASTVRVPIAEIAREAGVAIGLDREGRIDAASWTRLWPHLVRFVALSPGHYVAQARVEPAPFQAMIYDGRRIDAFEATTDFAAAFTLGWRRDGPRLQGAGTLCRAVPVGHPHTNITTRGALVPVMCEDEFDRLYAALGLDRDGEAVAPHGNVEREPAAVAA
ncbi:hypothetical protein BURK1_00473 [Burkholderiales bacterium]|nr:hypothetical protein BURK1_00473 [Burkholderiales bacterium]